ncbi:unnamed protein product [Didymodactylos carnosus]|uniref:3-hydroxyanthranilate 3,4-dioxygenase n=1 Tax=Didymodactylos carnosus TaxID=1234261 RepID=A0A814L1P3_9BILA|nr:unnamed protein product [Didymodactylos carnosus]CAF1058283.1 unnamed protein product [Didymodactylos carnosus]CAF3635002.1 unnamed protein product [Didymodactylos carnosus]CAF3827008.1 unnamed protein product [Didymodactylos carnosus]
MYSVQVVAEPQIGHNEQLSVMFVGGPNQRKDYHIEEGEELFYQTKGDMCLKVVEQGKSRDIIIKEGQIFLLPARIPHSPNRFENTVGLVIERRRTEEELDGLRYYVDDQNTDRLFERWFHVTNLGTQLPPLIKEYFTSEEYHTRKPREDSFPKVTPFPIDDKISVGDPFYLSDWLTKHSEDLKNGPVSLFPDKFQMQVIVRSNGDHTIQSQIELWLWQIRGKSTIRNNTENESYNLNETDALYLNANSKHLHKQILKNTHFRLQKYYTIRNDAPLLFQKMINRIN